MDEIAWFDETMTNIGGHFNPATSSFVCPYHGVYMFSFTFNADTGDAVHLGIKRNDTLFVTAQADITNDSKTTGSAVVVLECGPSQVVWVQCTHEGDLFGGGNRKTHFTGALLHAF